MCSRYEEDRSLAARAAEGLRQGRTEGVEELYRRYHGVLLAYARSRLGEQALAEDAVGRVWVLAMEGRLLEQYQGRASLRSYLLSVLEYVVRRVMRQRAAVVLVDEAVRDELPARGGGLARPPVEADRARVLRQAVGRALLELSEEHPRCALVIWMRLAGMPYREIARVELEIERPGTEPGEVDLRRRTDALKKLATRRSPPGCEARFRRILERVLRARGLGPEDLLG